MSFYNDIIKKQQIDTVTQHHPLIDEKFWIRANFLHAITFFILIDGDATVNEKKKLNELIDLLGCEDIKEDLYIFLDNPNPNTNTDEYEEIFAIFDSKKILKIYLKENIYLTTNGKFTRKEKIFIENIPQGKNLIQEFINKKNYKLENELLNMNIEYIYANNYFNIKMRKIKYIWRRRSRKGIRYIKKNGKYENRK